METYKKIFFQINAFVFQEPFNCSELKATLMVLVSVY